MDDPIEKKLSEMPTSQLVRVIQAALETMGESDQINFIAKHIDARTSLTRLGANDPEAFIDEVETFCLNCLNGTFYSDEEDINAFFSENRYDDTYYDDDWDYGEYYANTEWADTFSQLFKLSMMYIQSGDFETGHEATARLLSCLKELKSSDSFLGTDDPMSYISTDWADLFALHYEALFRHYKDSDKAIKMAFRYWKDFGSYCDDGFLNNVKDVVIAKRYILDEIRTSKDWAYQRSCFELLTRLHVRLDEVFDKAAQASELISCNVYFYLMAVEGLCETGRWHESVEIASVALARIPPADDSEDTREVRDQKEVRAAIQSRLADSYEQLSNFVMAFETLKCMFKESPSFALYKRARTLSEKTGSASALLALAEGILSKKGHSFGFSRNHLLLDIYSYEGETTKMLNIVKSQTINMSYYDLKYTALSFIYRAVSKISNIGNSLAEYLTTAAGQDGIADMLLAGDDDLRRTALLLYGADLLKEIIAFHINAAARNRYAKAAYYMCVVRDIFIYLMQEDNFKCYFQEVIQQNSRRPALRDEMSVVYGKAAVTVKKRG